MPNGFGMGVVPAQVGAALQQAPPTDFHMDPLPLRSDPPREHTPRPVDEQFEHSDTATRLALGEALTRAEGARTGEYQQPKSPLALYQMKRAGLSDVEIAILTRSTGVPRDATDFGSPTNGDIRRADSLATVAERHPPFTGLEGNRYDLYAAERAAGKHPTQLSPAALAAYGLRPAGGR